jgi:hypothetical protein
MLLNDLRADASLAPYIHQTCCENDVCVDFDPSLSQENYLVIKVDDYYNGLRLANTPKSTDCLIIQRCMAGHFHVFVVELKNVKRRNELDPDAIRGKFHTCLLDFMSNRFRKHFYKEDYDLKIRLYLIAGRVKDEYTVNFELDFLLSIFAIPFGNKHHLIKGEKPNFLIRPC